MLTILRIITQGWADPNNPKTRIYVGFGTRRKADFVRISDFVCLFVCLRSLAPKFTFPGGFHTIGCEDSKEWLLRCRVGMRHEGRRLSFEAQIISVTEIAECRVSRDFVSVLYSVAAGPFGGWY